MNPFCNECLFPDFHRSADRHFSGVAYLSGKSFNRQYWLRVATKKIVRTVSEKHVAEDELEYMNSGMPPAVNIHGAKLAKNVRCERAIRLSLVVSIGVFALKFAAWMYTGANSVLSDAAESFVHIFAVGFSAFGIWLSQKPPDHDHSYGHERIGFFAVGAEGMLIMVAAATIVYQSVKSLITGVQLQSLPSGAALVFISALANLLLGLYLVRVGNREGNMIIVANGKHTLTDVWTSSGVLVTLFLLMKTDWFFLDSVVALAIAGYISLEGFRLTRYAASGLMDATDLKTDQRLRELLDISMTGQMTSWHELRHRSTGNTLWVEFHVLFKEGVSLEEAHRDATMLEGRLIKEFGEQLVVTIHLEPEDCHRMHHQKHRDQRRPGDELSGAEAIHPETPG